MSAAGRIFLLWGIGVSSAAGLVAANLLNLRAPQAAAQELGRRALPADLALRDAALTNVDSQASFQTALQTQDPAARGTAIAAAQTFGQASDGLWATYLSHALNRPGERGLQQTYQVAAAQGRTLGAELVSLKPTSADYTTKLATERKEYDVEAGALSSLEATIYAPLVRAAGGQIATSILQTRNIVLGGFALLASLFTALALILIREARRDEKRFAAESEALRTAQEEAEFEASLQDAFEMAPDEESSLDVIKQALGIVAPSLPTELLLADSSQAHFRQVLATEPDTDCGCSVGSPADCPAAKGGHSRVFSDSTQLNTCRFLRGRTDPVWAVCVPVNVAGRAAGVVRTQQRLAHPLPERLAADLEVVARKTGERLGALRVLARTEVQAQTDPLTGLVNRRTLDAKMYELLKQHTPYIVAYADLDHFKAINDTHGHETGDRALRLFTRVLRDSVRPDDLVGRHGGEEFIVVLPECSLTDARAVAERVRKELAQALTHAAVPPFTVSIGLASSEPGDAFSDVVARADATMLRAKTEGRDRVLASGDAAPVFSLSATTLGR